MKKRMTIMPKIAAYLHSVRLFFVLSSWQMILLTLYCIFLWAWFSIYIYMTALLGMLFYSFLTVVLLRNSAFMWSTRIIVGVLCGISSCLLLAVPMIDEYAYLYVYNYFRTYVSPPPPNLDILLLWVTTLCALNALLIKPSWLNLSLKHDLPAQSESEVFAEKQTNFDLVEQHTLNHYPVKAGTSPIVFISLAGGIIYGIFMRIVFSNPSESLSTMSASFILGAPLVVGAIAVYISERFIHGQWFNHMSLGFAANSFFVIGTFLINLEGLICAIIIFPLFAILGAISGLITGVIIRAVRSPQHFLYSFAAIPLLFGYFERHLPVPEVQNTVERVIFIQAPPQHVWHQIHHIDQIHPDEIQNAWAYRIGVPLPQSAITKKYPEGLVRKIKMGKNVYFDQIVTEWHENQYVKWKYRFYEDSFPPNALDDHVVIGGRYFDLKDTSYTLTPLKNGTELSIKIHYRVNTMFNWYSNTVAKILLGNVAEIFLDFYRHRSELNALKLSDA